MIHVSFDEVDKFELRIPPDRAPGEDNTTPRICCCDDIISCLQAIPNAGEIINNMIDLGLPVILHAYYMTCDKILEDTRDKVPDASLTGEKWCLSMPTRIIRRDYELTEPLLEKITDMYGILGYLVIGGRLKRVKNQSNYKNFFRKMGVDYLFEDDVGKDLMQKVSFRKMMYGYKEVLEMMKNERI